MDHTETVCQARLLGIETHDKEVHVRITFGRDVAAEAQQISGVRYVAGSERWYYRVVEVVQMAATGLTLICRLPEPLEAGYRSGTFLVHGDSRVCEVKPCH